MMKITKKWIGAAAGLFGFISTSLVACAQSVSSVDPLKNPLGDSATFQSVLANINSFLLIIAAPICGIMVVWGGFQMMTAAGDPTKFSEGRKTLLYAAVGFVVVLFASGASQLIKCILNGS